MNEKGFWQALFGAQWLTLLIFIGFILIGIPVAMILLGKTLPFLLEGLLPYALIVVALGAFYIGKLMEDDNKRLAVGVIFPIIILLAIPLLVSHGLSFKSIAGESAPTANSAVLPFWVWVVLALIAGWLFYVSLKENN